MIARPDPSSAWLWRVAKLATLAAIATGIPWLAGLEGALARGFGLFLFVGLLWITEVLHVTTTALTVPLLAVGLGLLDLRAALAGFAHPVIFLFLGGFALAAALQRHALDRVIAAAVVRIASRDLGRAMILTCIATALLSMWISNTATAAMMLPLALGLLTEVEEEAKPKLCAFLLLGIAWSANIGGIGTLVGSPPNAIVAAHSGISFAQWLSIGLPLVAVLLPAALALLWLLLRPPLAGRRVAEPERVAAHPGSRIVLLIFGLTLAGWMFGVPLGKWLGIKEDMDALVALAGALALLVSGRLEWADVEKQVNWGVLLLFGGGITLSTVMGTTGTSAWLAGQMQSSLSSAGPLLFLLMVIVFVVFLTELVSNTASAALLVPLFAGVAAAVGQDPTRIAIAIGVAASCAFMLPVATPPNAIVFGTGLLPQQTMMRTGLVMNLVAIGVIGLVLAALT